jgi:hypothetical protein
MSPLARARAAMADGGDPLAFWELFARTELILALEAEPADDRIVPQVFETSDGPFALAFETAAALADFAGTAAPYAALPGRALAVMLGQGECGLALDPGGAAILISAQELDWLTQTLATPPETGAADIAEVLPPGDVPRPILDAIAGRLAPGLFESLVIARARTGDETAPLIAVLGAAPATEPPLAAALAEALAFAGAPPEWRIGFFPATGPLAQALRRAGLRLDIAEVEPPKPVPPGSDPSKPPRLR